MVYAQVTFKSEGVIHTKYFNDPGYKEMLEYLHIHYLPEIECQYDAPDDDYEILNIHIQTEPFN